MTINIHIPKTLTAAGARLIRELGHERFIILVAVFFAVAATTYHYLNNTIIAYGDAESHLNIAKRVVDSITPGLAQLGGIWLPLPHILMTPLVAIDGLWRTGLAGSIVAGLAYVLTAHFVYRLALMLTQRTGAAMIAAVLFVTNLNILYLQATPMTELPLIVFFMASTYYFVRYLYGHEHLNMLLASAFFGFCATLTRYDGWFLVLAQAGLLAAHHMGKAYMAYARERRDARTAGATPFARLRGLITDARVSLAREWWRIEGLVLVFATLAFFGILLWLLWDFLILGDPLYFTHSQFSAKSQQQGWLAKGQLPAYHSLGAALTYYTVTTMSNLGVIVFCLATLGLAIFLSDKTVRHRFSVAALLLVPFVFYVITLYVGQSIIFIPHITPQTFEWTLFNVRYGVMMVPAAAILISYFVSRLRTTPGRALVTCLIGAQFILYGIGYSTVVTYADGVSGLSTAKRPDAELWMAEHYDGGMVLLDDYSRLMSIIRSGIPMENVIYIGNQPYWEESLAQPEKYSTWVIVQSGDEVWRTVYEPEAAQGHLYKYFTKVYTSPEILIFKRTDALAATVPQ